MNTSSSNDVLFQKVQTKLIAFEKSKKAALISAFIVQIYTILFSIIVISLILGFLNVFPFEEFDFKIAVTIFKAFFYLIIALAVYKFASDQVKKWYLTRNPSKLKQKQHIRIISIILSVLIIISTWLMGTQFLGSELFSKEFFMKFGGTIIALLVLALPAFLLNKVEKRFSTKFKSALIPDILAGLDANALYKADECLSKESFTGSKLVHIHQIYRFKGSDLLEGKKEDMAYRMSYLNVYDKEVQKTSKGTKTEIKEVFNGMLFESHFNKSFKGQSFILPDVSRSVLGAVVGEMLNEAIHKKDTRLVKLEDPEFEKEFAMYSTDQIEARYILTPAFMERINELKSNFIDPIKISFTDNKIYIAVLSGRNLFDPNIFNKLDSPQTFSRYADMIGNMLKISEVLKLNLKIWE